MRFITWNCQVGGFRRKAAKIAPYAPDVLVVPEVENIERELFFDGPNQPTFRLRCSGKGWRRALGIFSYSAVRLDPVARPDEDLPTFARLAATGKGINFQVIAVWTYRVEDSAESYRQAHKGIVRHRDWIESAPTVLLGDFNTSAAYGKGEHWNELEQALADIGIVSAYHEHTGETPGKETKPTYFHKRQAASPAHLDYCFIPRAWVDRLRNVEVGAFEDWRDASDHMPLIVDVEL